MEKESSKNLLRKIVHAIVVAFSFVILGVYKVVNYILLFIFMTARCVIPIVAFALIYYYIAYFCFGKEYDYVWASLALILSFPTAYMAYALADKDEGFKKDFHD